MVMQPMFPSSPLPWPGHNQLVRRSTRPVGELDAVNVGDLLAQPAVKREIGCAQAREHLLRMARLQMHDRQIALRRLREPDLLPGNPQPAARLSIRAGMLSL